jgi:hypothetical protein
MPAKNKASTTRPAVAIAVAGPSPTGLGQADVVFEEAGTPLRYMAVYQSRWPTGVGPVTATQPTDVQALSVLHPVYGYDGSVAPFFLKLLGKSKLTDAGYTSHPSGYTALGAGVAASVPAIAAQGRGDKAPPPIFQYRGADSNGNTLAATGVSRAGQVRIAMPGHGTETWRFDAHTDRWTAAGGGPAFSAANLVVQTVPYRTINVNLKHGISVSSARVTGTGKAEVFSGSAAGSSDGTAATGTWSKPYLTDVTNYLDRSGYSMAFAPGPTWVILAPSGTRVSTTGGQ